MSDHKKQPATASAEVDWAEKLKASMNLSDADAPREEPSREEPSREEDDLAKLLRAQLNKNQTAETSIEIPDTSEFETLDDEEDEEDAEKEEYSDEDYFEDEDFEEDPIDEEYPEAEDFEEEPIDEDSPEDEDLEEDPIDEDYPEDEDLKEEPIDKDYPEDEDLEEEPIDEEYPEDEDIEEDPLTETVFYDDFFEDGTDEETIPEPITDTEEQDEAPLPAEDSDIPVIPPPRPVPPAPQTAPVQPYRRPTGETWTDDRLNGQISPEGMGGRRLHELAVENQRLVSESLAFPETEISADPIPTIPPVTTETQPESDHDAESSDSDKIEAVSETSEKKPTPEPPQTAQIYDPLQLGLDDISYTVQKRANPPRTAEAETTPPPTSVEPVQDRKEQPPTSSAPEPIETDSALGDTDLYMRLGYDEALHHVDEQMRVERLMAKAHESQNPCVSGEQPAVKAEREYHGREDTDRIEDAYSRAKYKNIGRLAVASMGALVALAYDLLAVLPASPAISPLTESAYYAPLGLLWTLLISLPFLSRLGRGLKSLLDFEPTRYAVSAVAILISLIHGVMSWVAGPEVDMTLFGGAALLMLTIAVLSELLVTEGEYRAFTVVSSGKKAHVLTDETTPASLALSESEGKVFTAVRTGRIADYFTRTQRYNPYMGRLNYFLPVTFLLAILCGGLEVVLGGALLTDGMQVFTAAYMTCLPSAYLLAMTLPLCSVNGYLKEKGAAVIGTAAPVDYVGRSPLRVIFSDGDALKTVNRKEITLRGDARSEEYRRQADIVFRFLQTPLATEPILQEGKIDHYTIEIAETEEQYMRLYLVDTEENISTEIMMGSHTALTQRGVRLPKLNMEQRYKKSEGSHVLYVAFNRSFHLAYAVEYRVGRRFMQMAAALQKMGCAVSVSSFDPLVDASSEGFRPLQELGITEVLRPAAFEPVRKARSGGLLATGRSSDLWHTLRACRAMLTVYRREHLCSWLSLLAAMGLVIPAVCLNREGWLISATAALWQLCHLGVTLWISLASAGGKKLSQDADQPPKNPEPSAEVPAPKAQAPAKKPDRKKTKQKRK